MQQFNPYQYNNINPSANIPAQGPNAVNINIIAPQAYGASNPINQPMNYASMYGQNVGNLPIYPQNYNNIFIPQQAQPQVIQQMPAQAPITQTEQNSSQNNSANALNDTQLYQKTPNDEQNTKKTEDKDKDNKETTKQITPLSNDYVKSLENYLNNDNPKIRLLGAKELLERFKESEDRKDNPSLIPLLNKMLKDPSPSVRFLGLTILQTGYSVGNDETIAILKQIQADNKDKIGEDSLLASEILLKLSAPQQVEVKESSGK